VQIAAVLLLFVPLFAPDSLVGLSGGKRTTTIVVKADGTLPNPDRWMVPGSGFAIIGADTLAVTPTDSGRTLKLAASSTPQPDDTLTLIWKSAQVTPISHFSYYEPYTPHPDSLPPQDRDSRTGKPSTPLDQWGGLKRSGSITRGLKFGEAGNSATSGLHLELSGRLAEDVNLEALVDDRSLPATSGGSSTTLRELDRLRVAVSTPSFSAVLGDWDLAWRSGRYGTIERRLKGGEVTGTRNKNELSAAVAGGGGRFATAILTGRGGDQGPYELTDRYGSVGIQVVSGSEKVTLDGRMLKRGLEADYRIEYDRGRIIFNPTVLIQGGSRIEVEYEVAEEAYSSNFYGVRGRSRGEKWSVEYLLAQEGLDEDQPLAFDWTPEFRSAVEQAGNDPQGAASSGVDSVGVGKGDYVWGSAVDSSRVLVFAPPDTFGHPTGYLRADFSLDLTGGYRRYYDDLLQSFYYRWEGVGRGDYSPVRRLPLPDRTRLGQAHATLGVGPFSSEIEVAGSEYDANIASTRGDQNNLAEAVNWQGGWSAPDSVASVGVSFRKLGAGFRSLARSNQVDHIYHWGVVGGTAGQSESAIESELVVRPLQGIRLAANAGRISLGEHFSGVRAGLSGDGVNQKLSGGIRAEVVSTEEDSTGVNGRSDRLSGQIERLPGSIRPSLRLRYEKNSSRRSSTLQDGSRLNELEPGVEVHPADWTKVRLGFLYRYDESVAGGKYIPYSTSRSTKAGWEGRTSTAIWTASAARTEEVFKSSGTSSLLSTQGAASLDVGRRTSPFHFRGNYDLTTGSGRTEAWVATYVGTGRGSYRREGDRYVPDENGDFERTLVATDSIRFATRVKFSGRFDWRATNRGDTLPPAFGISGTNTYFDASATTYDTDPTRIFLLDRSAFRSPGISSMRWNWRQDVNFLEGNPGGDGRLSLKRDESRDAGMAGGEELLTEAASLRIRTAITRSSSLTVEPRTDRSARRTISTGTLLSSVRAVGGEAELSLPGPLHNSEATLKGGLERRREAVTGGTIVERRIEPALRLPIGTGGSVRIEGEWRQLTGSGKISGYDLTRGWSVGNNWTASGSLDYRLGKNLTASALLRSRWQGRHAPLVSGLAEMTATL